MPNIENVRRCVTQEYVCAERSTEGSTEHPSPPATMLLSRMLQSDINGTSSIRNRRKSVSLLF